MSFPREYHCNLCGSTTRIEYEGGRDSCSACRDVGSLVQFLQKRNDLLRAELERLREALRWLDDYIGIALSNRGSVITAAAEKMREHLRAALRGGGE